MLYHIHIYIYIYMVIIIIMIIICGGLGDLDEVAEGPQQQSSDSPEFSLLRLSLLRFADSKFWEIPHGHENSTPSD